MEADVLLARCQQGLGAYGIRVEKGRRTWLATWAFPLEESRFARSGYGSSVTIRSGLELAESFRGCPRCESNSFVQCGGCHRLTCHRDGAPTWRCGWPPCDVSGCPEGPITGFRRGAQI